MAFYSSRLAMCSLILALGGCWTGALIESGRLHETVSRYERVLIDGNELLLEYSVDVSTSATRVHSEGGKTGRRAANLSIADLNAHPPHPIDSFPLRRSRSNPRTATPLPIRITTREASSRFLRADLPISETLAVEITEREGRHLGFHLCPDLEGRATADVDAGERKDACFGYFHSAALYDDPLAWWVYPVAPFTFAVDIALIPIQILTLPPLLLLSD